MNHFSYPLTFVQINIFEEPQNIFSTKIPDPKLSSQPPVFFTIECSPGDGKFIWFLHYNFWQGIMGSPVVGSTDSCREHLRLPTVVESTHSCPEYRKNLQLSGLPTAVESIFSCREHLQLSEVPPAVESIFSCREHLQLSKVPPVVESTSSCPKYLQLSRAPPVVQSTSSCREYLQLSKVSPVVQSTSSCPKYLQLSITSPVIESTPSCREYLHLSKARQLVESDFCQTGSVIPLQTFASFLKNSCFYSFSCSQVIWGNVYRNFCHESFCCDASLRFCRDTCGRNWRNLEFSPEGRW